MADEGHSVQLAARVLGVSASGYYEWNTRAPSARSIRHALLTDAIREVHTLSRGTYGFRRVHAELTLGRGLVVAHGTVELLMQRAGLKGVSRPLHTIGTVVRADGPFISVRVRSRRGVTHLEQYRRRDGSCVGGRGQTESVTADL
ncbi:IS3 family transposase [Geodermatophilus africanus]|nr:IS3 family transposase [Geodermatophilus africanus]